MKTRSQALRDLGLVIAEIAEVTRHLAPRDAAERAWFSGHQLTLEELEVEIARSRSEPST